MKMKYPNPSNYDKHISTKVDKTLRYVYFIDQEHPLSNRSKKVYYHRHIASVKLGKWLDSSYHVHHIDGNRENNDPSNLEIISPKMHGRRHFKHKANAKKIKLCLLCSTKFITVDDEFCSQSCAASHRQKGGLHNKLVKEELEKLIWTLPSTKIAERYGCSDVMVAKLCRKWNIKKPGRGYWMQHK